MLLSGSDKERLSRKQSTLVLKIWKVSISKKLCPKFRRGGTRESFLGLLGRCDFSPFTQFEANVSPSPWFTWSISICAAPGFSHKTLDTSLSFMPGLEYEIRSECDFHLEGN